jgi:hypothetical protein
MTQAITEKQFMAQIKELSAVFGWEYYHPYLSIHSPRGFPDVVLCKPPRVIIAELKRDKGKLSPHQEKWIALLEKCPGVEAYVWRPAQMDDIVAVLRGEPETRKPPASGRISDTGGRRHP